MGAIIGPDYGISWDENIQRLHGRVTVDYIADCLDWTQHQPLAPDHPFEDHVPGRYYGLLFQVTATLLEMVWGLESDAEFHALRHQMLFLLNALGLIGFYGLLRIRFGPSSWYPLVGTLLLVLSPRQFAHGFFNTKDMVLYPLCILSLFTFARYLQRPSWGRMLACSLACAFAFNARLLAIFLPFLFWGTVLVKVWWEKQKGTALASKRALQLLPFWGIYALTVWICWPNIWETPVQHFREAWAAMSHHPWSGEARLFNCWIQPGREFQGHYLPSWMLLTIPIGHLLLILTGLGLAVRHLIRRTGTWLDLTMGGYLMLPLAAIYWTQAVLYDDWRHTYFLYPGMIYFATLGIRAWTRHRKQLWVKCLWVLLVLDLLYTLFCMVRFHPHQQVYFNPMAGTSRTQRFDMDYWGLSYKQGILYLQDRFPDTPITLYFDNWPGEANYYALPSSRIPSIHPSWKSEGERHFWLTNFRWRKSLEGFIEKKPPFDAPYHLIRVQGTPILGIYEVTPNSPLLDQ